MSERTVEWALELSCEEILALAVRVETLETALRIVDELHGEASRWVYLDATPGQSYDDWEEMAKGRADFVVFETARALAGLSVGPADDTETT
jgi:hypothetical protein